MRVVELNYSNVEEIIIGVKLHKNDRQSIFALISNRPT